MNLIIPHPICWVVTDGKPGMENQALGLAEALEMDIVLKRTKLKFPWSGVTPYLRWGLSVCLSSKGDVLTGPWPDLLIASGRQSILPALYVKRASQKKTIIVYIQNPVISPKHFHLVVAPRHDNLTGDNVMVTQGALHRVTRSRLEAEKEKFSTFGNLPSPRIAVLLGGSNRSYQFDDHFAESLVRQLQQLQQSLMISPSRRTDPRLLHRLKTRLNPEKTYIWDGEGENPYFALLAWADAIFVTCDSISMITEASSTGTPVYLLRVPGGDSKFEAFHQHMVHEGYVRWFEGQLDLAPRRSLNETAWVAQHVKSLLRSGQT